MKKFFFFRSSAHSNGNTSQAQPPSRDKQVSENQTFGTSPYLRRSLSYSSGNPYNGGLGYRNLNSQSGSPCSSSSNIPLKQSGRHSSRGRDFTPERRPKAKCFEAAAAQNARRVEKPSCVTSSTAHCDLSENSSYSSSNVSTKVLDRYIDGEQKQENSSLKINPLMRDQMGNGNDSGKHAPRVQYEQPASPTDNRKQKPRSHSFREAKGSNVYFPSREWVDNGFGHESPRKLAKHVIERLSQTRGLPKTSSEEFDSDVPITVEDIYGRSLNNDPSLCSDGVSLKDFTLDGPDKTSNGYQHEDFSGFLERICSSADNCGIINPVEAEEDMDALLHLKSKNAEERAMFLSEELEHQNFLQDIGHSGPALIHAIKNLAEQRVNMAFEVSATLRDRIAERTTAKDELRLARVELDSRTQRLEKEKNELQVALEKELDRRSCEWSMKLEKYQAEEHRLRERVRELAEQNVSLQREVSCLTERGMESKSRITYSEQQLKDLTTKVEEAREENQILQRNHSDLQERWRAAEEDQDCFQRTYEEKEKEFKELHKSISRLLRTCSEQEKTIDGLREVLGEEVRKKTSLENFDDQFGKLQMEQTRLTGVEQALRKEVESCRLEVDCLRHENVNLLHRLKGSEKAGGFSTFKLDQELWNRVHCLQHQGLSVLTESIQLCTKLLEHIKVNTGRNSESRQGIEVCKNGLNGHFVVESDVKLQGFKRATENLKRSLQTMSAVLHEKSSCYLGESESHKLGDESGQRSEDKIRSELKAETLLTSLLREKLYSKELDMEQLQAELATAVRGNDTLRCEVQNAMDTCSCVTHKMKDLELQMIKKEESMNRLQNDLQDCTRELTIARGILPKVSEERDLMWEEVKQYSEKNMLLHSDINMLKKKIEVLDEDILLKEGQITILKDSLGKPFDLLASPDSTREFLLD
ncbi:unnamed protein product [Ilex paraguariensis]|uniref:DUF7653 domain-containing protein n=1 Tax=Ilex paraguariensis TaxID=185542 RepID=A0ABC8SD29_9AQUA